MEFNSPEAIQRRKEGWIALKEIALTQLGDSFTTTEERQRALKVKYNTVLRAYKQREREAQIQTREYSLKAAYGRGTGIQKLITVSLADAIALGYKPNHISLQS